MEIYTCGYCKNYLENNRCQAFPKGIPRIILEGKNNHEKPLSYQGNEIVFEPGDPELPVPPE